MRTQPATNRPRRSRFARILRAVCWALVGLLAWFTAVGARIVYRGSHDYAQNADCIIVLGAATHKDLPSPALLGRIRHGVELWKTGVAPKLIFTGGLHHDGTKPEATVAALAATDAGVPSGAILTGTNSTKTWENFAEAGRIMRENGLKTAIIVSDPYHLQRAQMMADDAGIVAFTSPTPYTAFSTWRNKLPFLINEIRLCHSHWMYRSLGRR